MLKIFGVGFFALAIAFFLVNPLKIKQEPVKSSDSSCDTEKLTNENLTSNEYRSFQSSIKNFGKKIYSRIMKENTNLDNIFFSPNSITLALGSLYFGAKERTKIDLEKVMNLEHLSDEKKAQSFYKLIDNKNSDCFNISMINEFWVDHLFPVHDEYIQFIKKYFLHEIKHLDFLNEPEISREIINNAIQNHTNGRIKDLIPPNMIKSETKLVLSNAIYFKANWWSPFETSSTVDRIFHSFNSKESKIPMMTQISHFNFAKTDQFRVIELPFDGFEYVMVIYVPFNFDKNLDFFNSIPDFEYNLLQMVKVNLTLPKFEFVCDYTLSRLFKSDFGLDSLFNENLNLSGISNSDQSVFVDSILHKAFVRVDESGTEAAAATAIFLAGSVPRKEHVEELYINHPFIITIENRNTRELLFAGTIFDPSQK